MITPIVPVTVSLLHPYMTSLSTIIINYIYLFSIEIRAHTWMGFFSRMGGLISRAAASPLGQKAFGWVKDKAYGLARTFGYKVADKIGINRGHVDSAVAAVGPSITQAIGEKNFNSAMRQFGVPMAERLNAIRLPGVIEGGSIGNTFYKGLQRGFDYLKNGGP